MQGDSYQVADVLMLVGNVVPLAVYFLILGLVNSYSRPYLVSCRSDFVALTAVLVPLLLWPVPVFARSGVWWPLFVGVCLAAGVFFRMLPGRTAGFVVYNVSERCCLRLVERALCGLGLSGEWEGRTWRSADGALSLRLRKFGLLRNVTVETESVGPRGEARVAELAARLEQELAGVSQLPSMTGTCLVVIGVALLVLPMWMLGRHIDDIVDAMAQILG